LRWPSLSLLRGRRRALRDCPYGASFRRGALCR
jgi:hypothetical protein